MSEVNPLTKMVLNQATKALVDVLRQVQVAAMDGNIDRWEMMSIGMSLTSALQPMLGVIKRLDVDEMSDVIDLLESMRFE